MTWHREGAEIAERRFAEQPGGMEALRRWQFEMNDGPQREEARILGQRWRGKYDSVDAFCFAQIVGMFAGGKIVRFSMPMPEGAPSDSDAAAINAGLESISAACESEFWGGKDDCDGGVRLRRDVVGVVCGANLELREAVVKAGTWFPLEVGYTEMSRSLAHLLQHGGLARSPYGMPFLFFHRVLRTDSVIEPTDAVKTWDI
jgi:hypothetical protein